MATQPVTKEAMIGTCKFCKGEFDKRKMTQHLKHCKQRVATLAAEAEDTKQQKNHAASPDRRGTLQPSVLDAPGIYLLPKTWQRWIAFSGASGLSVVVT